MYRFSTLVICLVVTVLLASAVEIGHRVGRVFQSRTDDSARSQTSAMQAAILGLFALLLGFTFTMSVQRFEARTRAVTAEANAIGTAHLRADLLPPADRAVAQDLLIRYIDLRIEASSVDLSHEGRLGQLSQEAGDVQRRLWSLGAAAATRDPNPVSTGLFVQAMNDLIDAQGDRNAALRNHLPEFVLVLLLVGFIVGGGVLGYCGGLGGRRAVFATVSMTVIIALVLFLVVDLDRPRRGIIRVDHSSLVDARRAMGQAPP